MKKLLYIIVLLDSFAHATVNECLSDVYFANGIDTKKKVANASARRLKIEFKSFNPTLYDKVAGWKVNYNHTHGILTQTKDKILEIESQLQPYPRHRDRSV